MREFLASVVGFTVAVAGGVFAATVLGGIWGVAARSANFIINL